MDEKLVETTLDEIIKQKKSVNDLLVLYANIELNERGKAIKEKTATVHMLLCVLETTLLEFKQQQVLVNKLFHELNLKYRELKQL